MRGREELDADAGPAERLRTRESLLSRLKDISEEGTWREFFELYWKLIFNMACRSGLSASDAEDVVQETMLSVMKHIPHFKYDRGRGTFKSWLLKITMSKIADLSRERKMDLPLCEEALNMADDNDISRQWEDEWRQNAFSEALRRVQRRVSPKAYQAYCYGVLQGKGASVTAKVLKIHAARVYVSVHRIQKYLAREMRALEEEGF